MRFAFSTVACPNWDLDTVAAKAAEFGYDGVELRGFLNETILTASNPFLTDPAKVRATFERNKVQICCLASSIAFQQKRKADAQSASNLRQFIDLASDVGCGLVKIFDTQVKPGQSRASAGVALGDWLLPVADYAAERDVVIVVENALSFRDAKEMWMILDRLGHPSVACCWDILNAATIGEHPSISVPTLNSKIQYVQLKDAKIGPLGVTYTKFGEGDVALEKFLIRLRGVGYDGWITVEWDKMWLPALAEPDEILPHAIGKLKEWTAKQDDDSGTKSDSAPAGAKHGAPPAKKAVAAT